MSVLHSNLPAYGFDSAPFAYGQPLSQGQFKTQPEDFIVEEVLGFEPSGEGEHLFLQLQTDDHNTRYTLKCLAKYFGVPKKAVSYSGLKDRRGLTSQWFSVHLPGKNVEVDAEILKEQGMVLLHSARHTKKLKIGTHKRNNFRIRIRNLSNPESFISRIEKVTTNGVPNYFGPQRFGHNGSNIEELHAWAEQQKLPQDRTQRSRVLSSLRSWVFNGELAKRVQGQTWNQWQLEDPIQLDGSHSYFTEPEWSSDLQQRLEQGDIHIAGWLPGAAASFLSDAQLVALLELAEAKNDVRAFRILPNNFHWQLESNDLLLSFELPKGAYATTVLRELIVLDEAMVDR